MVRLNTNWLSSWWATAAVAVSLVAALPVSAARADDDWEDYREELEERREEWREDREEALEEWYDDREDAWDDWRERRGRRRYYRPGPVYRDYHYPSRRYHYDYYDDDHYDYHPGPAHGDYYWYGPDYYEYYRRYPRYRYYGTPNIGYSEFGRERSVRFGPYTIYWDRD